jgi:hypothetical protein
MQQQTAGTTSMNASRISRQIPGKSQNKQPAKLISHDSLLPTNSMA